MPRSVRARIRLRLGALLLAALLAAPALSQPSTCVPTGEPGATMLIPYFEVDLDPTGGRTTLFSVSNAGDEPVVAHVVLWTNVGMPTLAFDLYLAADGVQSLNLRDVLNGVLPETGSGTGTIDGSPGCLDPLELPTFNPQLIDSLQAKHRGAASPVDGLCYGLPDDDGLATGFITVDAVNDCSETIELPSDAGYFVHEGAGLASNRNVLWGDVFLLDPSEDFAQGVAAAVVRADASITSGTTFYGFLAGTNASNRQPLATGFRSRYLNGGTFAGGTDLILWNDGPTRLTPFICGAQPGGFDTSFFFELEAYDEDGVSVLETGLGGSPRRTRRVRVGGDEIPLTAAAGMIDVRSFNFFGVIGVPIVDRSQGWMAPVISAANRFSVSLEATPIESICPP